MNGSRLHFVFKELISVLILLQIISIVQNDHDVEIYNVIDPGECLQSALKVIVTGRVDCCYWFQHLQSLLCQLANKSRRYLQPHVRNELCSYLHELNEQWSFISYVHKSFESAMMVGRTVSSSKVGRAVFKFFPQSIFFEAAGITGASIESTGRTYMCDIH